MILAVACSCSAAATRTATSTTATDQTTTSASSSPVNSGGTARSYRVQGCNMAPTLLPGYNVEVEPTPANIKRGDIIYFLAPPAYRTRPTDLRVSRVVGLPGEHIETNAKGVLVNGAPLSEPYLAAGTSGWTGTPSGAIKPQDIPADAYFVLGDNRENSQDSRYYGTVAGSDIQFRATTVDKSGTTADNASC